MVANKNILLLEDEDIIRRLVARFLIAQGYKVFEAADSSAAARIWAENSDTIQMLLTDIVLEDGTSGKAFARELQQQKPNLKIIYTSGLTLETLGLDLVSQDTTFIQKPYLPETLLDAIQRAFASC